MTCSAMTRLSGSRPNAGRCHAPTKEAAPQSTNGQSGPHCGRGRQAPDAAGPVTVISKTQVATGDSGSYDKAEGKVWLIGHVTLSDGQNVTKGRQADLRPQDRPGDRRHQRQVRASPRTIRPKIERADADKVGRRCCEAEIGAGHCRSFAASVRSKRAIVSERRRPA